MLPSQLLTALLFSTPFGVYARQDAPKGFVMDLKRRSQPSRTMKEWGAWAKSHREGLEEKYGHSTPQRRSTGTDLLTNQNGDSSYFGTLAIGTPPTPYNVILDTGSADLWVADVECTSGCGGVPLFNPNSSSTFQNQSTPFDITYGSGRALGYLGLDAVQMANFSVSNQVFAVCNRVSSGLLNNPVSGLLGLAFQTIAASKAMPFWQTLVSGGAWDEPLMAFQLTRFINATAVETEEPGGQFSMGFTNTSLYTGDIDYVNFPTSTGSYWILALQSVTVQGNTITFQNDSSSYAAIDTGTTLVGGPSDAIAKIFAQIPGSQPGSGDFQNYYTYPCNTNVNVSMNFGSKDWSISPADFQLIQLSRETCLGAFFSLTTGSSAPSWIVGDTFLKNVYSVFRYQPLSIGFAQLSSTGLAENGVSGPIPSSTVGTVATTVSATMIPNPSSNSAQPRTRVGGGAQRLGGQNFATRRCIMGAAVVLVALLL
ncbi:hypothetical protein CVT24_001613 [Panaeolus cyanescens]|uniref:Peptidase A1 domain-containing protein n=1 Tax=Panaeolus cyanescens TaxID=181874 RepID=A0A409W3M5_9AGAR|nr:hypothetical protein CVT24_001613 [Panaeolus cyanescens]